MERKKGNQQAHYVPHILTYFHMWLQHPCQLAINMLISFGSETNVPKSHLQYRQQSQALGPALFNSEVHYLKKKKLHCLSIAPKVPATLILYGFANQRLTTPSAISLPSFLCHTAPAPWWFLLRSLFTPSSNSYAVARVILLRDTLVIVTSCIKAQNIGKMTKSVERHIY